MNSIRIHNGKVFVNGAEIRQVEELNIHAEANEPVEIEMKWLIPMTGIAVNMSKINTHKCLICGQEGTLPLENGQWICDDCAMVMGEKSEN